MSSYHFFLGWVYELYWAPRFLSRYCSPQTTQGESKFNEEWKDLQNKKQSYKGITKRSQNKGVQKYLHKIEIKFKEYWNKYHRKLFIKTFVQVKEKIPETWERLSYLMDHNEERSADPGLWGTYRWCKNLQVILGNLCKLRIRSNAGLPTITIAIGIKEQNQRDTE